MSGGFGRKGVMAGAPVARSFGGAIASNPRPSEPVTGPDDGLSPAARAFIAAERARNSEARPMIDPMASATISGTYLAPSKPKSDRSMIVAYVLWWFGPVFAAHRFYLGAYRSGAALAGLFWGGLALGAIMSKKSSLWVGGYAVPPFWAAMILVWMGWSLIDAFLIPGLMRRYRASQHTDSLAQVFA
jgi:hypothetical protein